MKIVALVLPLAMLAACGPAESDAGEARAAAVPAATGFSGSIRPGQWQVVSTGDVDGRDAMCITPQQIAANSFAGNSLDDRDCAVSRDRMSGGVIELAAQCGSGRHPITYRGTYTETGFNIATTMEIPVQGKIETMRSNRIGRWIAPECGDEADMGDDDEA